MRGLALLTVLSLWAGPPEATPRHERPPARWFNGSGAMAIGGTLQVLGLGGGITGVVFGGSPGMMFTVYSTVPIAAGGGLVITGAGLRGRHQAWHDPRDLLGRVRTARRVGWPLMGVGLGLFVGNAVALLVWPFERYCVDEGCAAQYPGAFIASESGFVLGQLMIGVGTSTLAWSFSYSKARSRRIELAPTLGGLSVQF